MKNIKKIIVITALACCLILLFTACSGAAEDIVEKEAEAINGAVEAAQDGEAEEEAAEEVAQEASEQDAAQEAEQGGKVDKSLTGAALIASLDFSQPANISYKTTTVQKEDGVDVSFVSTIYMQDGNMRYENESEIEEMNMVMLYCEDEGMTYIWKPGDAQGTSFSDEDDMGMDDMGMDMDTEMLDEAALLEETENIVDAHFEMYEGMETIYMEVLSDEDGEQVIQKSWLSIKYKIPVRMEYYDASGTLMLSTTVSDISDSKIDGGMFTPPSDVEFVDMFEMFSFGE